MTNEETTLHKTAARIALLLEEHGEQLVLAESCTGGMVAAILAGVPGISKHFCGSLVVYQAETKHAWLNVDPGILQHPGPVSGAVTEELAKKSLMETTHATLSVGVTGHLGPDAPVNLDGVIFTAVAYRNETPNTIPEAVICLTAVETHLSENSESNQMQSIRIQRQLEATRIVLQQIEQAIEAK